MSWQLHKNSEKRKESREEGVKERRKETLRNPSTISYRRNCISTLKGQPPRQIRENGGLSHRSKEHQK